MESVAWRISMHFITPLNAVTMHLAVLTVILSFIQSSFGRLIIASSKLIIPGLVISVRRSLCCRPVKAMWSFSIELPSVVADEVWALNAAVWLTMWETELKPLYFSSCRMTL